MKKAKLTISLIMVLIIVATQIIIAAAEALDVEKLDKVIIKYKLVDGTEKEITQVNKKNGHFEDAINSVLDYYYNIYNIQEITTINDIPLKNTQFSKYAGPINASQKGIGYSNSQDIIQREKQNTDKRLYLANKNTGTTITAKIGDTNINFDVLPFIENNIIYVPFRNLSEALGYDISSDMNDYYKLVRAEKKVNNEVVCIEIKVGDVNAFTSKLGLVTMKNAPVYKSNTTFISIVDAEKLFNLIIRYDSSNKNITITPK